MQTNDVYVPDFQNAVITEEMLAEARRKVGLWLRRDVHSPALYEPISAIDIRRWSLYSVGDDNPLWSDEEYGRHTIWGGIVAPPTFLWTVDSTIIGTGFAGVQWIHGGTRWELFKPVRVGDQITARARLIDVREKTSKHVPRFAIQTGEVLFTNQRDELVARAEADILRVPRGRNAGGFRGFDERKERGRAHYSKEEIEEIRLAYISEERRGSVPRYWEEVSIGEELPRIVKGPLTLVDIVAFYAGRRTVYNPLKLAFLERERHPKNVYVSPQTGIPNHPAAGHFDVEIAAEIGMPGAYDQGWQRHNWIGHLVTSWSGDWSFVRRLDARLTLPNLVGDVTWCYGKVVDKSVEDGEHLVAIECWAVNQEGINTVKAFASVRLPSRSVADKFLI